MPILPFHFIGYYHYLSLEGNKCITKLVVRLFNPNNYKFLVFWLLLKISISHFLEKIEKLEIIYFLFIIGKLQGQLVQFTVDIKHVIPNNFDLQALSCWAVADAGWETKGGWNNGDVDLCEDLMVIWSFATVIYVYLEALRGAGAPSPLIRRCFYL